MKTIPEEQAAYMRAVALVMFVPAGVAIGACTALMAGEPRRAAIIAAVAGLFGFFIGIMATLTLAARHDRRLRRRLDAAGDATSSSALAGWPAATAVLSRALPARKEMASRVVLYTANTRDRGTLPVAVRLAGGAPPPGSGARLRLAPQDPAIAVIDPCATPADHAAAAQDPALGALSRTQRGLALPAASWLPWLAVGIVVAALTAVLLLVLG